ncbi:MAG: hypothetical protein CL662_05035 [Bacteroidetes bacterium]|nr:hypothetical protein [Bacteroidota bacterium]MAC06268.1 hypothetical protein [Balneola sp.]MAO78451.1 hypothetical protein [Balneola sp.]MBF63068.1 hypothetical protein [Balneola sp.]HAW81667.1 hypothetical protein [Balneola sp.]
MDIKFVKRSAINSSKKRNSKFKPLLEAIDKLKPGGQAIEVSYTSDKNVNSMRTAVYQHSRVKNIKIKSKKDPSIKKIHFYREE